MKRELRNQARVKAEKEKAMKKVKRQGITIKTQNKRKKVA